MARIGNIFRGSSNFAPEEKVMYEQSNNCREPAKIATPLERVGSGECSAAR